MNPSGQGKASPGSLLLDRSSVKTGNLSEAVEGEGCSERERLSCGLAALLRIGFRCWPLAARGISEIA